MEKQEINDLNGYDFYILLGLQGITEDDRLQIEYQLNSLAWERFLLEGLEDKLDEEGLQEINRLAKENKISEETINLITRKIPDLKEILSSFLSDAKKKLLKNHYQKILEESDQALFNLSLSEKEKDLSREKKNKYLKAKDFFEKEDWLSLSKLMKGED